MSYKLINMWVSPSMYHIKAPYSMKPESITIHETDNWASAYNEISYMRRNKNQTSFHVAIDDKNVIQSIPFNRNAWAAGDGARGKGNRTSIHIEICYNKENGYDGPMSAKLKKGISNAEWYAAMVCLQYGWHDVKPRLKRHYDWSRKNCPRKIIQTGYWKSFVDNVQKIVDDQLNKNKSSEEKTEVKKPEKVNTDGTYKVKSGDSLWSISRAHNVTVADLINWNKLSSNTIYSNQNLLVAKPKETSYRPKTEWKWAGTFTSNETIIVRRNGPGFKYPTVNKKSYLKPNTFVNFDRLYFVDNIWWIRFKYAAKGSSTSYFYAPVGYKISNVNFRETNEQNKLWGKVTSLNSNESKSGVVNWYEKDAIK